MKEKENHKDSLLLFWKKKKERREKRKERILKLWEAPDLLFE